MRVSAPRVSVVVSTCNRRGLLAGALDSLLAQRDAPAHEIIVVDNRSTDGTRDLVGSLMRQVTDGRLVYAYEPRQGLSHARNAGIALARAPLIAFTDDDVRADSGWVAAIHRAFERHPGAQYVGGRVLPDWTAPPSWLTQAHWSPLALQDHGPDPFEVDEQKPLCLVGANMAFRADTFALTGLFSPDVQLLPGMVGSTEDHELMRRVWRLGRHGIYDPSIVVRTSVQPERLTRRYHRRWHYAHGRSHARMRLPEMERSRAHPLGIPAHLFRQAAGDFLAALHGAMRRNAAASFEAQCRLWFFAGFARERLASSRDRKAEDIAPAADIRDPSLVSVVIPCYNQAVYLGEAVESALAQTYAPVEVVVVDDGSSDGTADVASRYGDGVRVVRQPNRGLAHARNAGLRESRGGMIVFLDADDRLHPAAVTLGAAALAGNPAAGLAFGSARVIDARGAAMFTAAPPATHEVGADGYGVLLRSNPIWTPAVAIFRRQALDAAGGFDPAVDASADYDLYLRIARGSPVVAHPEVVADYRHHDAAMSRNAARMLRTTLAVHRRQRRYARGNSAHREAYAAGRRFWRRFFGDQLMDAVSTDLHAGRIRSTLAGLFVMARYAPVRLAWHACRWFRHSVLGSGLSIEGRRW